MLKFQTQNMGKVVIRFRHNLPYVDIPHQNNSLVSIVHGIRLTQGSTSCAVSIDVNEQNEPLVEFYGEALTHPNDHYKKETGRVLSLTRAVENMV